MCERVIIVNTWTTLGVRMNLIDYGFIDTIFKYKYFKVDVKYLRY